MTAATAPLCGRTWGPRAWQLQMSGRPIPRRHCDHACLLDPGHDDKPHECLCGATTTRKDER